MPKSSGWRSHRSGIVALSLTAPYRSRMQRLPLQLLMQFWSTLGVSKIRSSLSANYVASPLGCSSACQTNISLSSIIRIPLLHYYHRTFQLGCATMGKKDWALERNLILMTRGKLRRLAADIDRNVTVGYTGLLAGPLSNRRRCRRASERWPRFRRKRLRVLGANQ
jgi:hypothetical protein